MPARAQETLQQRTQRPQQLAMLKVMPAAKQQVARKAALWWCSSLGELG